MKLRRLAVSLATLALFALPAAAADLGFRGFGIRAGFGNDPDQTLFGVQADLGELTERVRFQPGLEIGSGDDIDLFTLSLPALYEIPRRGNVHLFAGGGVVLSYSREDFVLGGFPRGNRREEDDFDIGPLLVGGAEVVMDEDTTFKRISLEINVAAGDSNDVRLLVGFIF